MTELALVTGAAGHIGGVLVRELVAQGRSVRVLEHDDARAIDGLDVQRVRGDMRDPASLAEAVKGVDVVFHLAAIISILGERGGLLTAINVQGVWNIARAAREAGVRRFVHFSSCHAFDLDQPHVDETTARPKPSDPAYNRSKAAGEQALRDQIARGLDAVIVNPTGVIGPYDFKPSRMGRLALHVMRRRMPSLVEGGFDWVDVRDVVRTALAAERAGRTGENYLTGGAWRSLADVAQILANVARVKPPAVVAPLWLARLGAPFMDLYNAMTDLEPLYTTESLHAVRATRDISSAKARRELGHTARPLQETLRDVHQWFSDAGMLRR